MPTTLQTKFLEDGQGNKYAPVTTPNAVRWSDGSNLNDHIDNGMKPEKLTIRLVPPEGSSASVLNGVPIIITVSYTVGSNQNGKNILDTTWEGSDIELELGTTWPMLVIIDAQFSGRYIPVATDDLYTNEWYLDNGHKALVIGILPLFNNERTLEINYIDTQTAVATIYIDDTINNPYDKITKSSMDFVIMDAIKSKFHRYLGKYDNGVLKMCQLCDHDSYLFSDAHYNQYGDIVGTEATTTGELGDVFVTCEQPIYTRYSVDTSLGHNRHKIEISFANSGSGWKEWHFGFGQDRDVIGAYKLCYDSGAPHSISSRVPIVWGNFRDYVSLFQNSPFRMVSWDEHNIIAVLFYAMYGTTNSVQQLGITTQWDNDAPVQNGVYTDVSGVSDTNGVQGPFSTNFLGLENWIGNVGEIIGNARCNVSQLDGSITVTDRNGTRNIAFPDPTYLLNSEYEEDGHIYTEEITDYSSVIFPKMQFGQNLDVVAATDAVDYALSQYNGEAYNDQQRNWSKYSLVIKEGGVTIEETTYDDLLNGVVARTGCPTVIGGGFYNNNFEGVASFALYSSADGVGDNYPLFGIGSRMCFTGTTQLIEDPADYIALFNE